MKGLEKSALSVSAVAFFISDLIKNQLGPVLIKGEISNLQLRRHSSYIRFSLKDSSAKIDCLTHSSSNAAKLLEHLQDGDEVLVFAQPSFYIKGGQISFFADEMMKLGEGIFRSQLEQLKQKLYEEGLFDHSRKKSLPQYPEKIGVVTSADGAALQDILRIANDRYPIVEILIFPCLVQGAQAPDSLFEALSEALTYNLDAIIIGRGGGSGEDLEAFNDEKLIRLVASSEIPIISAVGHEIDTTLIDYCADVSAPTPTGAAMILFPDKQELLRELSHISSELHDTMNYFIDKESYELDLVKEKIILGFEKFLIHEQEYISIFKMKLEENKPYNILNKGYSMILEDPSTFDTGKNITIITQKNKISATINDIKEITHEQ